MKKNSFFFIFFSFFFAFSGLFSVYAQTSEGYEKCELFKNFLHKNNISCLELPLMHASRELFPYSLKVDFDSPDEENGELYFVISMDDAVKHHTLILNILNSIEALYTKETGVHFIFSYGDNPETFASSTTSGIKSMINIMELTEKDAVVCVAFNNKINTIIPGGGGTFSPAHLISLTSNAFFESRLFYVIQGGILSPFYKKRILKENASSSAFLENSIPAIGIDFFVEQNSNADYRKKIIHFFENVSSNFSGKNYSWDRHSTVIQLGSYSLIIPEKATVTAICITILVTIFIMSFFPVLNKKAKKNFSKNILKAWIFIPARVALTALAFSAGQFFAWIIFKTVPSDSYIQLSIKFFTGFAIISFTYLITLKLHIFQPASFYTYMLPLTSIVNIFIFSAYDITFFYLFIVEYLIVYLSRVIKRTGTLALFFILLALPFLPYFVQLVLYAAPEKTHDIVFCSFLMNLIVSLAFMPFEYTWLRLLLRLNAVWKRVEKKRRTFIRQNVIAISLSVLIFTIILLLSAIFIPEEYKQTDNKPKTEKINDTDGSYIRIHVSDYENFKNLQRTLNIHLNEQFENVRVSVSSKENNPVVYSEYSYISEGKTDYFMMPLYPPSDFELSYIADEKITSIVTIEACKTLSDENKRIEITKTLEVDSFKKNNLEEVK